MRLGWLGWLSLELHTHILLLRLLPEPLVLLDALQKVLPTLGVGQVLDANVDSLGDDASAHPLVHDDAQSVRRDVEHTTRLPMVHLIRHTLLHSAVSLDVDNVADLVHLHVSREGNCAMLAELAREQVPRAASVTLRVRHGDELISLCNKKRSRVRLTICDQRALSSAKRPRVSYENPRKLEGDVL